MPALHVLFILLILTLAVLARWPQLRLPLDEDFATYTYIARFRKHGLRWKKDAFIFVHPVLRQQVLDWIYHRPEGGPRRVRLFLTGCHALTSVLIYGLAFTLTGSAWAALAGGLLNAFFLTAPSLETDSFNAEQLYVPCLLAGFWCALMGPPYAVPAGVAWGLMMIAKLTTGVYLPPFLLWMAFDQGPEPAFSAFVAAALVLAFALAVDAGRGFLDPEALKQIRARFAATLRVARRDPFWPRLWGDTRRIVAQTLPLWVMGLPALAGWCFGPYGGWFSLLTGITLLVLFAQRAFSRYHYLPWLSLLSLTSALGLARLAEWEAPYAVPLLAFLGLLTAWTAWRLRAFYLRPLAPDVLARYGKFEQLLYVPHLGRLLARTLRRRGESGQRLFVWGNFIQIYHDTGCPAADSFVHYAMGPWLDPALEPVFDSIIGGLIRHRPRYLVKVYPDLDLELLEEITGLKYELVKTVLARYPVYRLAAVSTPRQDPLNATWTEKSRWMELLTPGRHMPGISDADVAAGRTLRALTECRKLLRRNPLDRDARIFLGELCERLGLHRQAAAVFKQVLHLNPRLPRLRLLLARQKMHLLEFNEARFLLEDEIERFGGGTDTHFALGLLARATGQFPEALSHFEALLADNPEHLEALEQRAHCFEERGENLRAAEDYRQVWDRAVNPGQEGLRTQAAVALARLEAGSGGAAEQLAGYHRQAPENGPLHYALASALEQEGRTEEARERFERLTGELTSDLLQAAAWFRLARLSDNGEGRRCLQECLKRNPYHQAARQRLEEMEALHAPA